MVIFKYLSVFEISLFILSNSKLHHYFPFTLQQKVARLLSALGEAISDCAQFVLLLILALITSIKIFTHLVFFSWGFLSLTLLKSLVNFHAWATTLWKWYAGSHNWSSIIQSCFYLFIFYLSLIKKITIIFNPLAHKGRIKTSHTDKHKTWHLSHWIMETLLTILHDVCPPTVVTTESVDLLSLCEPETPANLTQTHPPFCTTVNVM